MGLCVEVEQVFSVEYLLTELAVIGEHARVMDGLHVLPEVSPVPADLATNCAPVAVWSVPHYVLVQLLGHTCNQRASDCSLFQESSSAQAYGS